jgi:hypothetical protein
VRRLASDALDEPLADGPREHLAAHLANCGDCRAFVDDLDRLRSLLRLAPVDEPADVAARVRATLESRQQTGVTQDPSTGAGLRGPRRGRTWSAFGQVAAVFVVAFAAGATAVTSVAPPRPALAGIAERIVAAQATVTALSAEIGVVEHGWHPEVSERHFEGTLRYGSPETLELTLTDRTDYPDDRWRRHDVHAVIAEDLAWSSGAAPCPVVSMPGCIPWEPRTEVIEGRRPFADGAIPLDLVVPVRSFTPAVEPTSLGTRIRDGRDEVGVEVSVAQAEPLLDALLAAGNWRELHRSDRVELWLDADHLVPVALTVRASGTEDRAIWATARGLPEPAGGTLLEVRLRDVRLNDEAEAPTVGSAPPVARRDTGFRSSPEIPAHVRPAIVPEGMELYRQGRSGQSGGPEVALSSWSDGRAWLVVRATEGWVGDRLFGDLGSAVRPVELPGGGIAYLAEGGGKLAIHGRSVDLVVEGSVPADTLIEVAAALPITGLEVPSSWAEGTLATLEEAAEVVPGLLVSDGLTGFSRPSVRIEDTTVIAAHQGPGARAFLLIQGPGGILSPPMDDDVRGVALRSTTARYTPGLGELEWVEDGDVVTLRSTSLSLEELVAIAETLDPLRPGDGP